MKKTMNKPHFTLEIIQALRSAIDVAIQAANAMLNLIQFQDGSTDAGELQTPENLHCAPNRELVSTPKIIAAYAYFMRDRGRFRIKFRPAISCFTPSMQPQEVQR